MINLITCFWNNSIETSSSLSIFTCECHGDELWNDCVFFKENTGQPRYLKVQGNGENTSSYPKFDISKMWRHPNVMYMFNFSKTLLQYMCSQTVPTENLIEMKTK